MSAVTLNLQHSTLLALLCFVGRVGAMQAANDTACTRHHELKQSAQRGLSVHNAHGCMCDVCCAIHFRLVYRRGRQSSSTVCSACCRSLAQRGDSLNQPPETLGGLSSLQQIPAVHCLCVNAVAAALLHGRCASMHSVCI